jgi:phosphinothricin acetyltransferase
MIISDITRDTTIENDLPLYVGNGEVTMSNTRIRMATLEDAPAILTIYEPYILKTAITFEYEPVPLDIFVERMRSVMKQFPWLVYEEEGKILGYAYCARFKERAAFDWDCECTVYIDESAHRKGIATALYNQLFDLVKEQGYYTIYALITYTHESSTQLHKKFGFTEVGVYQKTGYKMGRWWDLLVMEKRIRTFEEEPRTPRSIHEILHKE